MGQSAKADVEDGLPAAVVEERGEGDLGGAARPPPGRRALRQVSTVHDVVVVLADHAAAR